MRLHRPHVSHRTAKRVLWFFIGSLVLLEGSLALHLIRVHEAIAGGLGLTALCRDSFMILIENIGEA
jgi:hypothetical protein